jgi:hypothetical protein
MRNEKVEMRKKQRAMSFNTRLIVSLFVIGLFWNATPQAVAQRRGGDNETGAVETADAQRTVALSGKQWAVFIAIDNYKEWAPLQYPVKDAQEIKKILLDNYYIDEVREIYNRDATAAAIRKLFIELQDKTGPNDSVFVFHAGHGINEDRTRTPAWIPYDAGEDVYAQANWLSHLQIRSMLDSLKARHVFLISDSCFSGDLLDSTRGMYEIVVNYPSAYDRVSRQAMSSGASEQVDDDSEFASRLRNALLRTETPYITPDYLLSQIKDVQTSRPLSTIPILAAIPRSGHQLGGSFLFFRKNPRLPQPEPTPSPAAISPQPVNPQPAPQFPTPGETGYFIGSWTATVEYNNSYDTYLINFFANGRCMVKMTNDNAEQEADGNWSWDSKSEMFRLNAVFRNAKISYMRNIDWVSLVSFAGGNNSFHILVKPANNAPSNVRFTFFRE